MILNSRLARQLGRPDLAGQPRDPYGGTSNIPQTSGIAAKGSIALGTTGFAGDVAGRVTAGVLVLVLAGAVGLYLWTRNLQS